MIILDIESSGVDSGRCGIWQIGAIELENPRNYFLQDGRIDDEDKIEEGALKITGKTESELRDKKKQPQKQLILNYLNWAKNVDEKIAIGQNVGWDITFIQNKCVRYGITRDFREALGQRSMDLHTIIQMKHWEINGKYLKKDIGKSNMNLTETLKFCGLPDERMRLEDNGSGEIKVIQKGKTHNALEDCKLEGECFSRIRDGKNLFPEFLKFKIPEVLRKQRKLKIFKPRKSKKFPRNMEEIQI